MDIILKNIPQAKCFLIFLSLACFLFGFLGCNFLVQNDSIEGFTHLTFIDVGQGDASLIQGPERKFFLIDAGVEAEPVLKTLKMGKIDTLQWVMITHADRDHYGGLKQILTEIPVKKIYLPADTNTSSEWGLLLNTLRITGIPLDTLFLGDELESAGGLNFKIIWPMRTSTFTGNNASTVVMLNFRNSRVLFTGDIETEAEEQILSLHALEDVQLLKVPHHGSKTSSTLPFLASLSPQWAVISCDSTVYGHPHKESTNRLAEFIWDKNHILRTDERGSLVFELGQKGLIFKEHF